MKADKKLQAAIAGVLHYLKTEEEAKPAAPDVLISFPTPWALNGRQTIIQMRSLMQRRVLKR